MRFLAILTELLLLSSLFGGMIYFIKKIFKEQKHQKLWEQWQKKQVTLKDITIEKMFEDFSELEQLINNKVPYETLISLRNIQSTLKMLTDKEDIFNEWKKNYSDNSKDLFDILYKHIPTSLNHYFSVPEKFQSKEKHLQGHTANEILNDTFKLLEGRINSIAKDVIEENLNHLSTYQRYVKNKFDGKQYQFDIHD